MNEKQVSPKSKTAIKRAFLSLIEKKPYNKITVREITEAADVNRSTFYRYYLDIYDLLEQIEREIIEDVRDKVTGIKRENYIPGKHPQHTQVFRALFDRETECRILMSSNGDINFVKMLRKCLQDTLKECWGHYCNPVPEKFDLCTSYVASAIMGVFIEHIDTGCFTAEDLGYFTGEITEWIDEHFVIGGAIAIHPEPENE